MVNLEVRKDNDRPLKSERTVMKKSIFRKSISLICSIILVMIMCISVLLTEIDSVTLIANAANPYSNSYNIVDGVNYAIKWADSSNPDYKSINSWAGSRNCASFVSECLTAAGIHINQAKRELSYNWQNQLHYEYYNQEWSVARKQFEYLKNQGYAWETANDNTIHIGDVVYYDFKNNNSADNDVYDIDHAAYCIGIDYSNVPIIAEHSGSVIRAWNSTTGTRLHTYVVHMTNAVGHIDVTNQYRSKSINIKSLKNNYFVSSDTDNPSSNNTLAIANRSSVQGWEKFDVVTNTSVSSSGGTSYPISLKTCAGNYLSAYISESGNGTPLKNTQNNLTWEAFRIFRSGNTEYLLSLINGKFVQVRDDNKLYAAGEGGWSWESFDINQNYFSVSTPSYSNSYTIKSSSGAKVRAGAGTSYSQKGGLAKGSVVYYDRTASANGYIWYHITSVSAKSGSWGSYVGYWVANV